MPRRPSATRTDAVVDREWLADPVLRAVIRGPAEGAARRAHYPRTLEAWLDRLDAHRADADALLDHRAVARWRVFLLARAQTFDYRRGTESGVSHYLFARFGQRTYTGC